MFRDRTRNLRRPLVLSVVALGLAVSAAACDDDDDGNDAPTTTVSLETPNTTQPSANSLEPGTNQSTPQNQIPGASTGDTTGG